MNTQWFIMMMKMLQTSIIRLTKIVMNKLRKKAQRSAMCAWTNYILATGVEKYSKIMHI